MLRTGLVAFATFFVTVAPMKVAPVFSALTGRGSPAYRRRMAIKGTVIAGIILLIFGIWGDDLLRLLGISLPALRVGGGILLMLLSINMVFDRPGTASPATAEARGGGGDLPDIAAFPLAMPIIAGPATITALVVLISEVPDQVLAQVVIMGMLLVVLLITLVLLLAGQVQRLVGETAMNVVTRVLGILLMALAAQLVMDGLQGSEIFKK